MSLRTAFSETPVPSVFCQLGVCRLAAGKLTGLPVVMLPVCRGWACPVGGFLGLLHEGVGFAVAVALESGHPAVVDGTVD